jgi:methyl-accepting chemotaxis protein
VFSKLSLGSKFNAILIIVFIGGIALSAITLSQALQQLAADEVTSKGQVLIQTMNSVRTYTSTHVRPLLVDQLETSPTFISETVPAYSATEVFETLRENEEYGAFFYKEAALNPTNPRNQADEFEAALVEQFRSNPELHELSGYRTMFGERLYYTARPLSVSDESCLTCHSDPAVAPASLISTFGDSGGFGWEPDEIVAAQIIYVPAGNVIDIARLFLTTVLAIVAAAFAAVILAINILLRRAVLSPVGEITALAKSIAADELTEEDLDADSLRKVIKRSDELGQLAKVFQMMTCEVYIREQQLKQTVQELRIQIDEVKKAKQVEEITESDYFKDLKKRASDLRNRPADAD